MAKRHKSCVCFKHAKHDQTFYLIWCLEQQSEKFNAAQNALPKTIYMQKRRTPY